LGVEAEDAQRRERGDGTDVGDGGLREVQPHEVRQTRERGDRDRFAVAADSFFLVSTLITGCPAARCALACSLT
jgi:hypothetical protein